MRLFALAAAAAVASVGLSSCASPGFYGGGYYSDAPYAPAAVVYPEYGVPPPEPPPISAYGAYVPPRAACTPVWRCGYQGCSWQSGCAPRPEPYAGRYGTPDPRAYSAPAAAREPNSHRYAPQVYSVPPRPYSSEQTYGSANRP